MTTESGIPDPESPPSRRTRLQGPLFFPITAALSSVGTVSALGTALAPGDLLAAPLARWVSVVSSILYLLGLFASGIALLELLSGGLGRAASLTIAGRRCPNVLVGVILLLIYLLPWVPLGITLAFIAAR